MILQPEADESSSDRPLAASDPAVETGNASLPFGSDPLIPTNAKPPILSTAASARDQVYGAKTSSSSGSIPTHKSPASGSISVPKTKTSTSTGKSQADAKLSSTRKRLAGDEESCEEPHRIMPTLPRMSFIDEIDDFGDNFDDQSGPKRRNLTAEQQEMRWVMMLVGQAVGAGVAIILIWMLISWLFSAISPARLDTSPAAVGSIDETLHVSRQFMAC